MLLLKCTDLYPPCKIASFLGFISDKLPHSSVEKSLSLNFNDDYYVKVQKKKGKLKKSFTHLLALAM